MGMSKKMFNIEQEKSSITLEKYLDNQLKESQYYAKKQKKVLSEIFDSWGEILNNKK